MMDFSDAPSQADVLMSVCEPVDLTPHVSRIAGAAGQAKRGAVERSGTAVRRPWLRVDRVGRGEGGAMV